VGGMLDEKHVGDGQHRETDEGEAEQGGVQRLLRQERKSDHAEGDGEEGEEGAGGDGG